jgi:hypothetical protein
MKTNLEKINSHTVVILNRLILASKGGKVGIQKAVQRMNLNMTNIHIYGDYIFSCDFKEIPFRFIASLENNRTAIMHLPTKKYVDIDTWTY